MIIKNFGKDFKRNSALSYVEECASEPLNREETIYIQNSKNINDIYPKFTIAKFLGNDTLFCFVSINKFGSFKKLFETITSLSELLFRR